MRWLILLLCGCYEPEIADRQYSCRGTTNGCPDGLICDSCFYCVRPGHETDPLQCQSTGCAQARGGRSSGDPGLPSVAFCPAAWRVPGTSSASSLATPCNRVPGADGTAGGVDCSIEDNCAPGSHVCRSDGELALKGLTSQQCASQSGGFWATRQPGGMNFDCVAVGSNNVLGCGDLGSPTTVCAVIDRAMTAADCSLTGSWSCGTVGVDDRTEGLLVVKSTATSGGGVLCCADP
jgi:hypothetical protein